MDSRLKVQMAPPLSLLTLAALTGDEHTVWMEDENVERLNLTDRPDLVGITVKVDTAHRAFEIARMYRDQGVAVVLGGIHVSAFPQGCRDHADAIVIGEAELVWPQLLDDLQRGELQPVYEQRQAVAVEHIPQPDWSVIVGKDYLFSNAITLSRGCPWRCDFCYSSSPNLPRGHRVKTVDQILRDIRSLGTRHVMFVDDNFIGSPERCRDILDAIKPLGLTWHTAVSTDIGRRPDLLDAMVEAGCRSVFIGFESIHAENLAQCRKSQNLVEGYDETIRQVHDRGVMINASLAFGFDADTPATFDDTLQWLIERRIETMTAHILTPYPGTAFHDRLLREGRILDHDLRHYNTSRAVFQPAGMTVEQLERGYRDMYRRFYSWPNILRRCPGGSGQWRSFLLFNGIYRKAGPLVAQLSRCKALHRLGRWAARTSYRSLDQGVGGM